MKSGSQNANWRGGCTKPCPVCGTGFWVKPSHAAKRETCSRKCAAAICKTEGRVSGSNNPAFGAKKVSLSCVECGGVFTRLARIARKRQGQTFCSKRCAMLSAGRYEKTGENNPNYGNNALALDRNPNWRGGKTYEAKLIRKSDAYQKWRRAVISRDQYKCVQCGSEKNLEADHIKPLCSHGHLVMDLENGRTLCRPCHVKTDTYGWKSAKRKAA